MALPGVRGEGHEEHETPTLLQTGQDNGRPATLGRRGSCAPIATPSATSITSTSTSTIAITNAFGVAIVAPALLVDPGDSPPHHFADARATSSGASGPAEATGPITAQLVCGFVESRVLKDSPATLDELVCACASQLPGVTLSPNAGGRTGCDSSGDRWRQKRLDQAHDRWAHNHQCIYLIGTSAVTPLLA